MKIFNRYGWGRVLLFAAAVVTVFVGTAAAQRTGTFTDSRDGQTYKTVSIDGKHTWMAQNLNYTPQTGMSWCYKNSTDNCKQYGRLYDWNTAKTACPSGWHLPSREEWNGLVTASGGNVAGKVLKSVSGWENNGNGIDGNGFSALPGGDRNSDGNFDNAGNYGFWWTATEDNSGSAYYRNMNYDRDYVNEYSNYKSYGLSVRCVQ